MEMVHLIGAEDVQRAGSRIASAAQEMTSAANVISEAVFNFQRQIDRLEALLERAISELPHGE